MAAQNAETSWWNHRVHSLHRERLSQVKSTMNIRDESHIVKIDSRKREFNRQQREAKIEHDNKKLVINMMQIVAKSGNEYHPKPPHKIISRAEALRRKQSQDIARENYVRSHPSCLYFDALGCSRVPFFCSFPDPRHAHYQSETVDGRWQTRTRFSRTRANCASLLYCVVVDLIHVLFIRLFTSCQVKNRTHHTKHLLKLMATGGVETHSASPPQSPPGPSERGHSASASSILAGAGARSLGGK
jgi:hypothetical protein